jgi:outer membrane receptor for ferrienterochelin and colicins
MHNLFPNFLTRVKTVRSLRAGVLLLVLVCAATGSAQESPALSTPLSTDDMSIEELMQVDVPTVYGASKYQQTISEAPASVTVITEDEIKMYGYRNLAAILQSVRGFSMSYDQNYDYVGIRGFSRPGDYNTRVLLLIDGIRINDAVYDQAGVGNDFPLDVDLIERVEIIRGPSQSLYGSNAFFGVINVVTKGGRALGGAELSGEGGSLATYKGRASYGRKFSNGAEAAGSC